MAKKSLNPPAAETIKLIDGDFAWDIPRDTLRALNPVSATGNSIVLADASSRVSIQHEDGMYYNYSIAVRLSREPIGADETDKCAALAKHSKAERDKRDAEDAAKRQRELAEAVSRNQEALERGMAISAAKNGGVKTLDELVRETVAAKLNETLLGSKPTA